MTSIASMLSGQFFQLPTGSDSTSTASDGSTSSATAMPNLASALAQADSTSSSSDNSSDNSFLLDLSPTAQNYLQQLSGGSGASGALNGSGFILSTQQQQQVSTILAKYKDAPYTQDTYNDIQNDLKAAGLSPQQLGMEDQIRQFNPISELVDALSGKSSGLSPMDFGNSTDEQANANSYMQGIVNQWQTVSTTAASANDSVSGGDSTSGSAAS